MLEHDILLLMLSVPSKHALKALLTLAEYPRGNFVKVEQLAEEAKLPGPYLSKLLKTLARVGVVDTRKGRNGGVALPDRMVSISEICEAFNDPIVRSYCLLSKTACSSKSPCPLHHQWNKERERIHRFLARLKV